MNTNSEAIHLDFRFGSAEDVEEIVHLVRLVRLLVTRSTKVESDLGNDHCVAPTCTIGKILS